MMKIAFKAIFLGGLLMTSQAAAPVFAAEPATIQQSPGNAVFNAERSHRTHSFTLAMPVGEAITLFTPEGEKRWAGDWNPRYLAPSSGKTVEGMVFTTDHGGAHTVWTLVRYRPEDGLVEYVRDTPGSRIAIVRVQCHVVGKQSTRVAVTYIFTGLSEAGNAYIRDLNEQRYAEYIDSWRKDIAKAGLARAN